MGLMASFGIELRLRLLVRQSDEQTQSKPRFRDDVSTLKY